MAWYNANWTKRKKITVKASEVDSTLTDFPVYVDLSAVAGITNPDGIRVTKADETTEVAREIVSADEMYFKADSLSATTDTDFYIYYGNAGASDYATNATYGAENVWDSNFKLVSHNGSDDSTSNAHNGTLNGDASVQTSQSAVGEEAVSGDGNGDYVAFGDIGVSGNSQITVSVFSYVNGSTSDGAIWGGNNTTESGDDRTGLRYDSRGYSGGGSNVFKFAVSTGGGDSQSESSNQSVSYTTWQALAFSWASGEQPKLYIDGSEDTPSFGGGSISGSIDDMTNFCLFIGARDASMNGYIDEVRVSNIDRGSSWNTSEQINLQTPTTFYTVGSEETSVSTWQAQGNGEVTDDGGGTITRRGFVYSTTSYGDPGNVSPAASNYEAVEDESGTYGEVTFDLLMTGLDPDTTYYVRAFAENSAGYSYGNQESFATSSSVSYPTKIKVAGTFVEVQPKVKVGGTFVAYTPKIKQGGTFS